jgi:hypothetical protein
VIGILLLAKAGMPDSWRSSYMRAAQYVILAAGAVALLLAAGHEDLTGPLPLDDPAINYYKIANDPVARLNRRLDSGDIKLEYEPSHGYLRSVLDALAVPVSSQVLVFSKTSIQSPLIAPRTPRAVYHSDDVSVGWVHQGDALELTAWDPKVGVNFYTLGQERSERPMFARRGGDCLKCHALSITKSVPGLMVSSAVVDPTGKPQPPGAYVTDHRLPLSKRFGGWFVTGASGSLRHMGNALVGFGGAADDLDRERGANVTDLRSFLNTAPYLTADSDIVSLMMLEHESQMTNLIIRAGYLAMLKRPTEQTVAELVKYMLFVEEPPLESPIKGTSSYATDFTALGPRDKKGRSLRDFDLSKRMLEYPCSPLIYSAAFDALPQAVKDQIYSGLWATLRAEKSPKSQVIVEILHETKRDLPAYWKP